LERFEMEKVGIFYGHLEYINAIWYTLWPFGKVGAIWYIFPPFGILCQEKSGNPEAHARPRGRGQKNLLIATHRFAQANANSARPQNASAYSRDRKMFFVRVLLVV
jgi:hypothetical protein